MDSSDDTDPITPLSCHPYGTYLFMMMCVTIMTSPGLKKNLANADLIGADYKSTPADWA